jgi:hypothetical protein
MIVRELPYNKIKIGLRVRIKETGEWATIVKFDPYSWPFPVRWRIRKDNNSELLPLFSYYEVLLNDGKPVYVHDLLIDFP